MRRAFSRLSYANVVATVALFVALGGSSYAALKLPRHSVGTKQLKPNAVTSSKVKAGTLKLSDLKKSARHGLRGEKGAQGPAGATNVVMRQGPDTSLPTGTPAVPGFAKAEASCQPGERATGGGLYNEANVALVAITSSYPTPNPTTPPATGNGQTPTGWRVWARNETGTVYTVNAYVICAAP